MPATAERLKKKPKDLSQMDWESLLDKALRAGRDYELRRQIDSELKKRVSRGFVRESYCPIRMWTH